MSDEEISNEDAMTLYRDVAEPFLLRMMTEDPIDMIDSLTYDDMLVMFGLLRHAVDSKFFPIGE